MTLILIYGGVGSGKTLLMVILAYLDSKKNIMSNIGIHIPNKNILPLEPRRIFNDEVDNCILLLDEAYTLLDSREAMKGSNKFYTQLLFQKRKRNIDILCTVQLISTIDTRYRQFLKENDGVVIHCKENKPLERFEYTMFTRDAETKSVLPFEQAKSFYGLYDTLEMVQKTHNSNPMDLEFLREKIPELMEKYYEQYPNLNKLRKSNIKIVCMENGISNSKDIDYIYNKIDADKETYFE